MDATARPVRNRGMDAIIARPDQNQSVTMATKAAVHLSAINARSVARGAFNDTAFIKLSEMVFHLVPEIQADEYNA